MKHIVIGVGLLMLQISLTFLGELPLGKALFDKYLNPVFLFVVSMAIPVYLIWLYVKNPLPSISQPVTKVWHRLLWTLSGLLSVAVIYEEMRKAFIKYSEPEKWSDVIPQVRVLYERFSHGQFPYTPIELTGYNLVPVYMPLHWMPSGLAVPMNIDLRWIGFIFFALAAAVYGWYLSGQPGNFSSRFISLILPSLPLWAFIRWGNIDLMVTYEIVIGAYYFLLATGLVSRKLWLITLGIILCLLSRYTLLFWLPLFAILLFLEMGLKKSVMVWGAVIVSFLIVFVIPFYMKGPSQLNEGLTYYMGATVAEWQGYGDPPVSWTHERGVSFAPHMKSFFSGDMANRVHWARIVQGAFLLLTFGISWWAYRQWRNRIDVYTFSLITLYSFMTVYYLFAPLTYRYYLFSLLVVSAVLCGKILMVGYLVSANSKAGNQV